MIQSIEQANQARLEAISAESTLFPYRMEDDMPEDAAVHMSPVMAPRVISRPRSN